jgi:hypothetical protein
LRDRKPKQHGVREKKKTKKAILGDQRPRNFRLIASRLNRGFEDLDSAFKVEKVERRVNLTPHINAGHRACLRREEVGICSLPAVKNVIQQISSSKAVPTHQRTVGQHRCS